MFKNLVSKIKSFIFKAQKIDPDSAFAKAQAKVIDDLVSQAEVVADIASVTATKIVADAKKEVSKAAKQAVKAKKAGPRPGNAKKAAGSKIKKSRPKK